MHIYIYAYIYIYIYMHMYSKIVHHILCFNLFLRHNNSFDNYSRSFSDISFTLFKTSRHLN